MRYYPDILKDKFKKHLGKTTEPKADPGVFPKHRRLDVNLMLGEVESLRD
jgi:hypothetical protein